MSPSRLLLVALLSLSPTIQAIELDTEQAERIGRQIWHNEGLGKIENLTVWNQGEAFPSFGIGHFIWYPSGVDEPFQESFPALVDYLATNQSIPNWLHGDAPWRTREEFYQSITGPRLTALRQLLQHTIPQQTRFIIQRLERALPKMLAELDESEREFVRQRFYAVLEQANGPYALIDYVNFKGEGTNSKERYDGKGWGLLQVLQEMDGNNPEVMLAFVHAADFVLTRRVNHAPRDERRWLDGWRNRLQTYLTAP